MTLCQIFPLLHFLYIPYLQFPLHICWIIYSHLLVLLIFSIFQYLCLYAELCINFPSLPSSSLILFSASSNSCLINLLSLWWIISLGNLQYFIMTSFLSDYWCVESLYILVYEMPLKVVSHLILPSSPKGCVFPA